MVKVFLGLGALAGLAYLFASTLSDVSSEPYEVSAGQLRQWTIEPGPLGDPQAPVLMLRPPRELTMGLFDQVFQRTMESYTTPADPGIPLLQRSELQAAPPIPPDTLIAMAHEAGLGTTELTPTCMAVYRTDAGREQRLFFVLFEVSGFARFREDVRDQLVASGADTTFEPEALAPALLIASSDPRLLREMPPRADLEQACEAPVESRS